jgi:hypothetical protein
VPTRWKYELRGTPTNHLLFDAQFGRSTYLLDYLEQISEGDQDRVQLMTPTWNGKAAKAAKEYIPSLRHLRLPSRSSLDRRAKAGPLCPPWWYGLEHDGN